MFDNTITVTRNSIAIVLTRISEQNGQSLYRFRDSTHEVTLNIRHSTERPQADGRQMERHNYVLERTVFGVSPAKPTLESLSVTIRFQIGADPVENQRTALAALGFGTAANVGRLVLGES